MAESLEYTELEARYQRYREILKNLTLMSDIFMRNVLKQKECTEHMCKEMDQIYQEGAVQGRKEGRAEGRIEGEMTAKKNMAMSLAGMGLSAEKIAEAAKVSVQMVQEWLMGKTDLAK